MMEHGTTPPTAKTLKELGTLVAQLRYDAMIVFFCAFKEEIIRQRDADELRGRGYACLVASRLILSLYGCLSYMRELRNVAIPHMQNDIKERPLLPDPDAN
jgi:hypothetical protein